jgi:predicted dinucleotide-utilizing enzyme
MNERKEVIVYDVVIHPDQNEDADKLEGKIRNKIEHYIINHEKDMDNDMVLTIPFASKDACEDVISKILKAGIKRDMYVLEYDVWSDNKWKKN